MKFQSGRWLNGCSLCEKKRRRLAARSASVCIPCTGSFMESRSVNKQCWHYTTGQCAAMIIESKVLRPADCYISPREKAILWFSANQFWELTANKGRVFPRLECQFLAGTSINTSAGAQLFDSPKTTSF